MAWGEGKRGEREKQREREEQAGSESLRMK